MAKSGSDGDLGVIIVTLDRCCCDCCGCFGLCRLGGESSSSGGLCSECGSVDRMAYICVWDDSCFRTTNRVDFCCVFLPVVAVSNSRSTGGFPFLYSK